MHIFRDGHFVVRVFFIWQDEPTGDKDTSDRFRGAPADMVANREPWLSTLGKIFEAAMEDVREKAAIRNTYKGIWLLKSVAGMAELDVGS